MYTHKKLWRITSIMLLVALFVTSMTYWPDGIRNVYADVTEKPIQNGKVNPDFLEKSREEDAQEQAGESGEGAEVDLQSRYTKLLEQMSDFKDGEENKEEGEGYIPEDAPLYGDMRGGSEPPASSWGETPMQAQGSGTMSAAAAAAYEFGHNKYPAASFHYRTNGQESISLNTGSLKYSEIDAVLPGKGGLDLAIGVRYDSDKAETVSIEELKNVTDLADSDQPYKSSNMLAKFAFGWGFQFPVMQKIPGNKHWYLTMSDGSTYKYNPNIAADDKTASGWYSSLEGYDVWDKQLETAGKNDFYYGGRNAKYYLVDWNTLRRDYFDADGYLIGILDKYNNTIGFEYTMVNGVNTKVVITDSYGRQVTLSRNSGGTISMTLPDGENVTYAADYLFYQKINQAGEATSYLYDYAEQNFSFTWYRNNSKAPTVDPNSGWNFNANLVRITYPTGGYTEYTYDRGTTSHTHNDPDRTEHYGGCNDALKHLGEDGYGYQTYAAIWQRKDVEGGVVYNHEKYTIGDGYIVHTGDTREPAGNYGTGSIYETDVQNVSKGTTTYYEFNRYHLEKNEMTAGGGSGAYETKDFSYYRHPDSHTYLPLPTSVTHNTYTSSSAYIQVKDNYQYDIYGDMTQHTFTSPFSQTQTMTHDRDVMTSNKYRKDASNWVIETNEAGSTVVGGTHITESKVTEGSAGTENVRKLEKYAYNTDGTIRQEKIYRSATDYTQIDYDYQYNADKSYKVTKVTTSYPVLTPALRLTETYSYDKMGNLVEYKDPEEAITRYEYDARERIKKQINPDSSSKNYVYTVNSSLNRLVETDERGYKTTYNYTKLGNIENVAREGITQASFTYDSAMRLATEKNALNAITSYTYHPILDRILSKTVKDKDNAELYRENYDYTVASITVPGTSGSISTMKTTKTVAGETNAPAINTSSYCDQLGREVRQTLYNNGTEITDNYTSFSYDYLGNIVQTQSAGDREKGWQPTNYKVDYAGNVLEKSKRESATSSNYVTEKATYDYLGNILTKMDALLKTASYRYDPLGRLEYAKEPFKGNTYAETEYKYDKNGNLAEQISYGDASSQKRTEYKYNNRGFLKEVMQYDGGKVSVTSYDYDLVGNLEHMTNPGGHTTDYINDPFNRVKKITDPLGQSETYEEYDSAGNLTLKTDRNGNKIVNTYDGLGRLRTTTAKNSSGIAFPEFTEQSYTKTGSLKELKNESMTVTYVYDSKGRNTGVTENTGIVKTYGYDLAGNRTTFILKQGTTNKLNESYTYDFMHRLKTVSNNGTLVDTYNYNNNGNVTDQVLSGPGITTTYGYNDAGLITSLSNTKGSTTLSQYGYEYYRDGNVKTKQATVTGSGTVTTDYFYDDLGRLTKEQTPALTKVYGYDLGHNRTKLTVSGSENYVTDYDYDANNRLREDRKTQGIRTDITDYYYDKNGNQITKLKSVEDNTSLSTPSLSMRLLGEETFTDPVVELSSYDAFNRLKKVTSGTTTAAYAYQPDGMRLSKTVDGVKTTHIWDGQNIVAELNNANTMQSRYVIGLTRISQVDVSNVNSYYLYNTHGDVVQLASSTGAVTKTYDYDAFGVEIGPVATDTNPFRYCGEYFDKETDSIYLRARYYSPSNGRMLSEDLVRAINQKMPNGQEIVKPLSLNLYIYCYNNPILYSDPSGLFGENTILKKGSSGSDVEKLQRRLQALGYFKLPKGARYGTFSDVTLAAVNKYKKDKGLWNFDNYYGKVGETTWKSLGLKIDNYREYGRTSGNSAASSNTLYVNLQKPSQNNGLTSVGVEAGLVKVGGDYKYGAWGIEGVSGSAKAGWGTDYVGVKAGASTVSGQAMAKIPILFTEKKLIVGAEGELLATGIRGYYEEGKIKIGASYIVGGSLIVGIE